MPVEALFHGSAKLRREVNDSLLADADAAQTESLASVCTESIE
jgi:hypothetical protein